MITIISDFPILWPGFHLVVTTGRNKSKLKALIGLHLDNFRFTEGEINSHLSFRNKPVTLEPQDSTNYAYDHVKTRHMRLSTCYVERPGL